MTIKTSVFKAAQGHVYVIPILSDNYAYIVEYKGLIIIIDPGEAPPIMEALEHFGLEPQGILVTHGDSDHYDGVGELCEKYSIEVWVPPRSGRKGHPIDPEKGVSIGNLHFDVLDTPGHRDHDLTFYQPQMGVAFCGDALFVGGCGRVNTNHPEWLWASLLKIRALPDNTSLFCGHEYSLSNLAFARNEQGKDPAFESREKVLQKILNEGGYSMPTTVLEEKQSNIFLRCDDPQWIKECGLEGHSPEEVFSIIRQRKNNF